MKGILSFVEQVQCLHVYAREHNLWDFYSCANTRTMLGCILDSSDMVRRLTISKNNYSAERVELD